jgi:hypothetical protein
MPANNTIGQGGIKRAATIASGESESEAVSIHDVGPRGLGVEIPNGWTAADIGFLGADEEDAAAWAVVRDSDGVVKVTNIETAELAMYQVPASAWVAGAYAYLKLTSLDTSTGAAVNQEAERACRMALLG